MATRTDVPTLSLPEKSTTQTKHRSRTRSGSLLKVEQVGESSAEQDLDQNLYVNINADWVNMKGGHAPSTTPARSHRFILPPLGAWLVHPVLVFCGKVVVDTIPGMNQEVSWTLTNLLYLLVSFVRRLRPRSSYDIDLTPRRSHTLSSTGRLEFHSNPTCTVVHMTT